MTIGQIMTEIPDQGARAEACLRQVESFHPDDLARPDFHTAALTFALLALRDTLVDPFTGRSVGDVFCNSSR